MLLESFIDQQKQAVKRNLEKHFARYIIYKKDHFELMLHLLESMVKDQLIYRQSRHIVSHPNDVPFHLEAIEIAQEDFETRVRASLAATAARDGA